MEATRKMNNLVKMFPEFRQLDALMMGIHPRMGELSPVSLVSQFELGMIAEVLMVNSNMVKLIKTYQDMFKHSTVQFDTINSMIVISGEEMNVRVHVSAEGKYEDVSADFRSGYIRNRAMEEPSITQTNPMYDAEIMVLEYVKYCALSILDGNTKSLGEMPQFDSLKEKLRWLVNHWFDLACTESDYARDYNSHIYVNPKLLNLLGEMDEAEYEYVMHNFGRIINERESIEFMYLGYHVCPEVRMLESDGSIVFVRVLYFYGDDKPSEELQDMENAVKSLLETMLKEALRN